MTTNETLGRFRALKVWKRGSLRAPHKPLLILLALGRIQRGEGRLVRFLDVEDRMWAMLQQFGQTSGRQSPDNPFWYMRSDGLWEIPGADLLLCPGQKRRIFRLNVYTSFPAWTFDWPLLSLLLWAGLCAASTSAKPALEVAREYRPCARA